MSEDTQLIEFDVRAAVDENAAIADRVRTVTLNALSRGKVDGPALRDVTAAVLRGAQQGIERPERERQQALREAVRGLDEALAAAAQATMLALQEAMGRGSDFSRTEMRTALDQIRAMEANFLETLTHAGRSATGVARTTLQELADHARNSGTAIGARVAGASVEFGRAFTDLTRDQVKSSAKTVRNEAGLFAALAAGILRGIADRLHPDYRNQGTPPAPGPRL